MKTRYPIAMGLALAGCLAFAAPALAVDRIEKTFNLQPGGRFRLETGMGRVRLTGKPGAGVHFVVTSRGRELDDLLTFRYEESPQSVTIVAGTSFIVAGLVAWSRRSERWTDTPTIRCQ